MHLLVRRCHLLARRCRIGLACSELKKRQYYLIALESLTDIGWLFEFRYVSQPGRPERWLVTRVQRSG